MSDDSKSIKYEGPQDHGCEQPGCKKQGGWGYEREAKRIEWRCYEHRDMNYRSKSR